MTAPVDLTLVRQDWNILPERVLCPALMAMDICKRAGTI